MENKAIKCKAYAKINLTLNITGVKDGMHLLDMVLTSVSIADDIVIKKRQDNQINIRVINTRSLADHNSIEKTVEALKSRVGEFGADISVTKKIPFAGGMGGSSATASGIIEGINCLYSFNLSLQQKAEIGLSIGSDVPYMLQGGFARVTGCGEIVEKFKSDTVLNMVIVSHSEGVSSGDSYKKFDEIYESKSLVLANNDTLVKKLQNGESDIYSLVSNALTKPSSELFGGITSTINMLSQTPCSGVVMTGSGACVVAFYDSIKTAKSVVKDLKSKGVTCECATNVEYGVEIK